MKPEPVRPAAVITKPPGRVLFLCVHNSARSQMAEGFARSMAPPGVDVMSAGTEPGKVHEKAIEVMVVEVERRLEPNQLFAYLYTQLDPISRLPRKVAHVLNELEQGTFKIGIEPTGLGELEANLRSMANRVGASLIVGALLLASALVVRVHRFEWLGIAGFSLAAVLGLYMVWKIIRTPGEL